jgi:hypothetical protein
MGHLNDDIAILRVRCQRMAPTLRTCDIVIVDRARKRIYSDLIYAIHMRLG